MEDTGIELNDGTAKVFLSTKGKIDDISRPLKIFLEYVDGKAPADELTENIDSEVNVARNCEEWRREYMTLALEIEREKKQSWLEGRAEGMLEAKNDNVIGMFKEKIPVNVIARITQMEVEQIIEIGKKNSLL